MTSKFLASEYIPSRVIYLDKDYNSSITFNDSNEELEIEKTEPIRIGNVRNIGISEQFKEIQYSIMKEQIPILTKLLSETYFDIGYESLAEKYFNELYIEYGIIADTILQNIYLENMYSNRFILKHLLYIISNLSGERRKNLEIIPLAGLSNPDIEIQDLSVKCFEEWQDKRHIITLKHFAEGISVKWFKNYVDEVVKELQEG